MNRVDGKVALVTGAASGIGLTTALLLREAGATLVATDRTPEDLRKLEAALGGGDGAAAMTLALDVTREDHWAQASARIVERFGRLDVLVNNAGLFRHGRIEDTTLADIDTLFDVNLKGVVLGMREAFRVMKKRPPDAPSASIVNLSSIAGLIGSSSSALYGMTKGGVRLYTKSAALEAAQFRYNIRCNSVHPGIVRTPMAERVAEGLVARGQNPAQVEATMAAGHPLGRLAQPIDIARGILFLASDDSSFMTGSELVIDGGWTAR